MVEAIHTAVAGRVRFKVEGLYRSKSLEKLLESRLARLKDISLASANALTGNVLVCYNSGNTPQTIAALIEGIISDYLSQPPSSSALVLSQTKAAAEREDQAGVIDRFKGLFAYPEEQQGEPWHRLEAEAALAKWQTSRETGLSLEAVQRHQRKYGVNILPEAEPRSGWEIFFEQFNSLPVYLLGAAAGLSVVTGGMVDAVLIMSVVVANAFIGYKTESESEKTIRSLQTLVRPGALVIREGRLSEIPSEEVTPGDLLVLRPGSYVAADGRLIEASHLSVDESALTGESMPVTKNPQVLEQETIPLGDRLNLVFMGTLVTGGEGLAVVVATGSFTEIGLIQSLIGEAASPETPLERQLGQLGDQLVLLCLGISGVVFVMGFAWGYGWLEMLRTSICLAAAAVPEGLPAAATTTLALGIRDMRKHHVLIRHLNAVETLGSVQTVCLDKTGTITRNQMSVLQIFSGMKAIKVVKDGQFLGPQGPIAPFACEELEQLLQISVLCNEIEIYQEGGDYVLRGTATEGALVQLAVLAGLDVGDLRARYPLLKINYRSENRLFMGTLHEYAPAGKLFALKGNPLEVLAMCSWHLQDGRKLPLTEEDRQRIEAENEEMAGQALRVLGLAFAQGEDESIFEKLDGLVWLGMVGMADPIRDGVGDAIRAFHRAGIDTVMITGDQSPTAYAIGRELELSQGEPLKILDATHLAEIEPEVLRALVKRAQVFARVSPAHKLQIVQALQGAGKVIAMTGDGINDGPALKAADVGIAMGRTGTDIAREVADVVLEKDNLDTLIIAIRDGRTIYLNIRKSVHFFLATNLSEIMLTFTAIAVGLGSPLTAAHFLWINLISDIFPGLALALEAPEPDILERPPRDPQRPIFTGSDFKRMAFESGAITAGAFGAYGYSMMRYGLGAQTSTLAFHSLTTGQLLHAISCRSETHSIFSAEKLPPNPYLTMALGGSLVMQFLTMVVPGLRSLLGLAPVGLLDGLVISGTALLPLVVNEATKKPPVDGVNDTQESRPE